ncbi:MAG: hypothetical protein LBT89_03615 [Planctomycetaceae bacterium]|jgi:Mg2+ and Co2+ transporter CorA|nr:hypothetical protein [Planctomycetaceae bacterium]
MSNPYQEPEDVETTAVVKRGLTWWGLTWAEWSIVAAAGCILLAFLYGWHANYAVKQANAKLESLREAIVKAEGIKGDIDEKIRIRAEELNRSTTLAAEEARKSSEQRIKELGDRVVSLTTTIKTLTEQNRRFASEYKDGQQKFSDERDYANRLDQFIDKHESTRWFSLEGRPKRR